MRSCFDTVTKPPSSTSKTEFAPKAKDTSPLFPEVIKTFPPFFTVIFELYKPSAAPFVEVSWVIIKSPAISMSALLAVNFISVPAAGVAISNFPPDATLNFVLIPLA